MVLKEQILVFKRSADIIYKTGDYTSAAIIYFKALFAMQDFILMNKIGYSPKDHTERFRLLQKEFPEEYDVLDSEFNTYRSTYSERISKETCDRIRGLVENAIRDHKIE